MDPFQQKILRFSLYLYQTGAANDVWLNKIYRWAFHSHLPDRKDQLLFHDRDKCQNRIDFVCLP